MYRWTSLIHSIMCSNFNWMHDIEWILRNNFEKIANMYSFQNYETIDVRNNNRTFHLEKRSSMWDLTVFETTETTLDKFCYVKVIRSLVQFLLPCFNSIRDDSIGLNLLGLQWKTRFWNFQTEIMFHRDVERWPKNLPDLLDLKTSQDLTF